MASKIPPHVARELKRHVVKQQQKTTSSSSPNSNGSSSSKVLAGVLALTGTMTVVPYLFINWIQPLTDRDEELTQSQIRRGAFNNSGSRKVLRISVVLSCDFKNLLPYEVSML